VVEVPVQTVSLPLMDPGAGGDPTHAVRLAAADVPQAFVAVTVRVPPAGPAVTEMESVMDVPVQPPGNAQV
jgi:hypothetical protein